jgi:hypothetical protein
VDSTRHFRSINRSFEAFAHVRYYGVSLPYALVCHPTEEVIVNPNIATPEMRDFAEKLLAREMQLHTDAGTSVPLRVFDALRRPLSTLVGVNGFRVLVVRALALAKAEIPCMSTIDVKPDGSLAGLNDLIFREQQEAGAVLIAHLLGLLATFIGEVLMMQIVLDVWPDATAIHAGTFGEGESDAKG